MLRLARGRLGRATSPRLPAACLLVLALLVYFRHGDGQVRDPHARHAQCAIPIEAYVGAVDPRFGFAPEEVERALSEAAALWQAHSERPLFAATEPRRRMPIDLVFDERQILSNEMHARQQALESEERELHAAQEEYLRLQRELERDLEEHRRALERFNHEAARQAPADAREWGFGDGPGGLAPRPSPAGGVSRLERSRLEREQQALEARVAALNEMVSTIHERIEDFNDRVASFNEVAAGASITAGGYTFDGREGRRVTIYRANNYNELVLVLAHELGHALGLGHVDDPDAVMHEVVNEIVLPVRGLSAADAEALSAACGGITRGG